MKRAVTVLGLCAVCVASAISVNAAVSGAINYQAVLMQNGTPVTTPTTVTFTVYDAASGGATVWTESKSVTPDNLGRVSIQLGDLTPFPDEAFSSGERWLGVTVQGDTEMSPRMKLASATSALRVASINGAQAGSLTGDLRVVASAAAKDASASEARLILVGLAGDSIILGPADQVILRAVDNLGAEALSMEIDPVVGPVLGIRDPGGMVSEHSGRSSSYYSNVAKDANALQKSVELGADGVFMFNSYGDTLMAAVDVAGQADFSIYDPTAVAKDVSAVGKRRFHVSGLTGNVSSTGKLFVGQNNVIVASKRIDKAASNPGDPYIVAGIGNTWGIGDNSAILGNNHHLDGEGCFLAGDSNDVQSDFSFALGTANFVLGSNNTVMGRANIAENADQSAVIGDSNYVGGVQNVCMGKQNSIGNHTNSASNCSVLGGQHNEIQYGANASIVAGDFQFMTGSTFSIIGAGRNNRIDNSLVFPANVDVAGIFSGSDNYVGNTWAFIGGGYSNSATGLYSLCAGGNQNSSSGNQSTVSGGGSNTASGSSAVVCGGEYGIASGQNSVVSGGYSNQATGDKSTVPGGHGCTAAGDYSFAAGTEAKANNAGEFVWADNSPSQFPVATESNFTPSSRDFLARATGGFVLVTAVDVNGNSTAGAKLPANDGSWATLSDRNSKADFAAVNEEAVLDKVAALEISEWSYRAQGPTVRHIGPMAQDFYEAFGVGVDERHISTVDADGIALAAIKALHKKTQDLESQKTEIDSLRDQIAELKQLVESLAGQR